MENRIFAKIENGKVTQVDVIHYSEITTEADGQTYLQNFYGDSAIWKETKSDGSIRANHAGIGMNYDETNDIFYENSPFPSWTLNTTTGKWEPPVTRPVIDYSTNPNQYAVWNEENQQWDVLDLPS